MKPHLTLLFLATAGLASAQTPQAKPAAPPLRMGLWQSEITVEMSGLPGGTGAPSTTVKRHCMQAESWKETMQQMQNQDQPGGCTTSNVQQDEHHMAFDQSCKAKDGFTTTAHVELQLDSKEAMHGSLSMKMIVPGMAQAITSQSTFKSKFVNADCGNLKPGEQKDAPPSGY